MGGAGRAGSQRTGHWSKHHRCSVLAGSGERSDPNYTGRGGGIEAQSGTGLCQVLQSKVRTENKNGPLDFYNISYYIVSK